MKATYYELKREESGHVAAKSGHEVDDDVVDEHSGEVERYIREGVCND